jgi:hypothetical protein
MTGVDGQDDDGGEHHRYNSAHGREFVQSKEGYCECFPIFWDRYRLILTAAQLKRYEEKERLTREAYERLILEGWSVTLTPQRALSEEEGIMMALLLME